MNYKALILDLDGTLVESIPGIEASANLAFAETGFPTRTTAEVFSFIGNGSWDFFKKALPTEPDETIKKVESVFKRHYPEQWRAGTSVFDGIFDFLKFAQNKGIKLTVLSNKPHPFTVEIVSALFSEIDFEIVMGQSEGIEKKPAPEGTLLILEKLGISPEDALFIGDSIVDINTAHNAKVDCAAVTWGYEPLEEIQALKPKFIVDKVVNLYEIL
ncbi:HAD-IA family hydrolase [Akkermansiaceae bacterium]|nr:HAD-IA family hydrolase [Akkermansiaceae bacterium]